jgi:Na+-transporting methylmalonyl-CoA/oxaloacetate decarboxylase gamma subunit
MELNPIVLGVLTIIGTGMILAVLILTLCVMCRKCSNCRHGELPPKSRHEENYSWLFSEEVQDQMLSATVEKKRMEGIIKYDEQG